MVKAADCQFEKIELCKQSLSKKDFQAMIYNMYNTICFSTFPYLTYKHEHSMQTIRSFSSGNCISFAYFMQNYLKKNHGVKSFLIGASVPDIFKVMGTPHMCHCALLIPISTNEFYVMDGALYFLEPMYCTLQDQKERHIYNSNAHRHEKTKINYSLQRCDNCVLDVDYNQTIPKDSLCVQATFDAFPDQTWNYYLNEIKNPDNNIGHAFLLHKSEPFLMYTVFEDNMVKMKYKVNVVNDEVVIKQYPDETILYQGNTYDNNPIYYDLKRILHRYFLDFMI